MLLEKSRECFSLVGKYAMQNVARMITRGTGARQKQSSCKPLFLHSKESLLLFLIILQIISNTNYAKLDRKYCKILTFFENISGKSSFLYCAHTKLLT